MLKTNHYITIYISEKLNIAMSVFFPPISFSPYYVPLGALYQFNVYAKYKYFFFTDTKHFYNKHIFTGSQIEFRLFTFYFTLCEHFY